MLTLLNFSILYIQGIDKATETFSWFSFIVPVPISIFLFFYKPTAISLLFKSGYELMRSNKIQFVMLTCMTANTFASLSISGVSHGLTSLVGFFIQNYSIIQIESIGDFFIFIVNGFNVPAFIMALGMLIVCQLLIANKENEIDIELKNHDYSFGKRIKRTKPKKASFVFKTPENKQNNVIDRIQKIRNKPLRSH